MDSAWAVVVGAAIAAGATMGGAPITAWFTDRRSRANARRDSLQAAIEEGIAALIEYAVFSSSPPMTPKRLSSERVLKAAGSIGLLVEKGDAAVVQFFLATFNMMNAFPQRSSAFTGQAAELLPGWYRGDTPTSLLAELSDQWFAILEREKMQAESAG